MRHYRELRSGDRVRIVGGCFSGTGGTGFIGRNAIVVKIDTHKSSLNMPIQIRPDKLRAQYWWCRENLRALPRKGKKNGDN